MALSETEPTAEPGPAASALRHRSTAIRGLQAGIVVILTTGVMCQFVQQTDPTFPLLYFTVDSAVLQVAVMMWRLTGQTADSIRLDRVRGAAAVGVVLSALMFATVIAPNSPSGGWFNAHDDLWVRIANVALHGLAPFPVVAEFLAEPYPDRPVFKEATAFTWWPLLYLVVLGGMSWAGLAGMPYVFLQPSHNGMGPTSATIVGLWSIVVALGAALLAAHRFARRRPAV